MAEISAIYHRFQLSISIAQGSEFSINLSLYILVSLLCIAVFTFINLDLKSCSTYFLVSRKYLLFCIFCHRFKVVGFKSFAQLRISFICLLEFVDQNLMVFLLCINFLILD